MAAVVHTGETGLAPRLRLGREEGKWPPIEDA
jgi:hypothetical protein